MSAPERNPARNRAGKKENSPEPFREEGEGKKAKGEKRGSILFAVREGQGKGSNGRGLSGGVKPGVRHPSQTGEEGRKGRKKRITPEAYPRLGERGKKKRGKGKTALREELLLRQWREDS